MIQLNFIANGYINFQPSWIAIDNGITYTIYWDPTNGYWVMSGWPYSGEPRNNTPPPSFPVTGWYIFGSTDTVIFDFNLGNCFTPTPTPPPTLFITPTPTPSPSPFITPSPTPTPTPLCFDFTFPPTPAPTLFGDLCIIFEEPQTTPCGSNIARCVIGPNVNLINPGSGLPYGTNSNAYQIEKQYYSGQTASFNLLDMTLNGVQYASGQNLTFTALSGLTIGLGLDGNPYVMNISDWLTSIAVGSGFVFYDAMRVVDMPSLSSTYNIVIEYVGGGTYTYTQDGFGFGPSATYYYQIRTCQCL